MSEVQEKVSCLKLRDCNTQYYKVMSNERTDNTGFVKISIKEKCHELEHTSKVITQFNGIPYK